MTFPLYGDSFGQLAGQQQSYDQFFNGINQANRAALADANNRNLEMAFRSRDIQAQDARALANQDEEARRYALALANQAQDRADQISQARAGQEYQNMAFKARQANDAALLQLERDKLAAMQGGKTDPEEQALMLSEHLGQLRETADSAAAQMAATQQAIEEAKRKGAQAGYKLVDDRRGNLTFVYNRQEPLAPGQVTADQLNGALAEAMKADKAAQMAAQRAKQQFEKNLWNAKQFGLSHGITVGDTGITTKGGSQYRFSPGGAAAVGAPTTISPTVLRINRSGELNSAPDSELQPSFTPGSPTQQPSAQSQNGFVIPQQFPVRGFTPSPAPRFSPLSDEQIGVLLQNTNASRTLPPQSDFRFPTTFSVPGWTQPQAPRTPAPVDLSALAEKAAQNDPYGYARSTGFTPPQY